MDYEKLYNAIKDDLDRWRISAKSVETTIVLALILREALKREEKED